MAQDRPETPPQVADQTIAAAATAAGPAALAVVRLSGAGAKAATLAFLRVDDLEPRRATVARAFFEGEIDDVVATFFPGPRSATGEDLVEISCHGSPRIVRRLLEAALAGGARLARPGEFTQRAYRNGRMDLAQAEAVCDLIAARTAEAHRAALQQLDGGLSKEISCLRKPVLELLVRIEANLDHPEEDVPSMPSAEFAAAARAAQDSVSALARTHDRGRLVREGLRVAIVGRPNAGKSSLLNALIGRDRAIVCSQPGTTRDTLEEAADLNGVASVLIDTAGLREEASDPAEKIGMERTARALREADAAILVVDGAKAPDDEDRRVHERILLEAARSGRKIVTVLNKSDLAKGKSDGLRVSTVTREGLEDLVSLMAAELADQGEAAPVLVTSLRHRDALERAARELHAAGLCVERFPGRWEDRAASRLRAAIAALDEIGGAGAPDEVLAEIFSRFCVGK